MKNPIYIFILLIFQSMIAYAQDAKSIEADSAYVKGDYEKAIALYEKMAAEEGVSGELYYNLATAAAKAHDYGKSVLYYERGLRLSPGDDRIRHNLQYVAGKVEDANRGELRGKRMKVTADEPSFFQNLYSLIAIDHSSNMWGIIGASCFILCVLGVAFYIFSANVLMRKIGFFGSFITLSLTIMSLLFAFMASRHAVADNEGVVTAYKVALSTEPKIDSEEMPVSLTRGTKMRIVSEETDSEGNVTWYRVILNSEFIGWIKADEFAVI